MQTRWLAPIVILVGIGSSALLAADANPLVEELVTRGVTVAGDVKIVLARPLLDDGLSAAEQRRRIAAVGEDRQSWDSLSRHSVVAPFVLKISQPDDATQAAGRTVDLYFVAYAPLDRLGSDDFLQEQYQDARDGAEAENRPRAQLLTDEQLRQHGLKPPVAAGDARYLLVEMNLLDRVRIRATTRNVRTSTADSVTVASTLDPAFDGDAALSCIWQSIERDAAGKRQYGAEHPYAGLGSYVRATRLVEPAGALWIEYHIAFAEPNGWFHGANLLRSKLPIVAQDGVRRFRRNLEKRP